MPIYEYRCSSCGHQQEFMQKLSDPVLTTCTKCNQPTFSKMLTAAGFQLKGSGWYVTDFKNKASGAKAASPKGGESSGGEKSADGGDKSGGDKSGSDKSASDKSGSDKSGSDKSDGDKGVAAKPAEKKADSAAVSKPAPAAGGSST